MPNKYSYLYIVQGRYASPYGWEDVDQSENYKVARESLKAYRDNETQYPHRMIRRRVLNEANTAYQVEEEPLKPLIKNVAELP